MPLPHPKCTAKAKSTGERCGQLAMKGGDKCWLHGGKSLRGLSSPSYRGRGFSKYVPKLAPFLLEAEQDERLRNLTAEVELYYARQVQLLQRLHREEGAPLWQDLSSAFTDLQAAQQAKDGKRTQEAYVRLATLIRRGADEAKLWQEIMEVTAEKRKTLEAQWRRLDKLDQYVMVTEITVMLRAFIDAIAAILQRHDSPAVVGGEILEAGERVFGFVRTPAKA